MTQEKYCIAPGVSLFTIDGQSLAVGGTAVSHFINGFPDLALRFLVPFSQPEGATFDEAFAGIAQEPEVTEHRADFERLLKQLSTTGTLRSQGAPTLHQPFEGALLLVPKPSGALPDDLGLGLPTQVVEMNADGTGLDRVEAILRATPKTLVLAFGLEDTAMHAVNRWATARKQPWAFVAHFGDRSYLSPILHAGNTPCFACLRIQRLGALGSISPNALMEHLVTHQEPTQRVASQTDPRRIQTVLNLFALKLAGTPDDPATPFQSIGPAMPKIARRFHRYDPVEGDLRPLLVLRLPGCPVCG